LWTDPREERLVSPPPWWRLVRTCPRVGPPSTGTPKARATATAHGVFFPTGTVIVAGKGWRLPISVYWRNSPAPESGGRFARGYSCMRKGPRREREPIGPNGWAQIPYPGGNNGVRRASPPNNTVPCGKFPRGRGRHYRTRREVLPFCLGNNTVLVGKHYRTRGERIPFSWGSITVPVGNEYRTHGELC
jgi:hypothetical protein